MALMSVLTVASACSTTSPSSSPAPTTTVTSGPAGSAAGTSAPPGTTSTVGTTPTEAPIEELTITIDDPTSGRLVFDAIAAGDPARAKAGKLVLLLHGYPETSEAWREQLQPLAAAGYYAVAPNQRGYSPGARPAGIEPYAIPSLIADVFAMATALGADTFDVVGHDWGAAVAWVVAAAKPERVRSLAAVSVPHPDAFSAAFANPDGEQTRKSRYIDAFRAEGSEDRFTANGGAGMAVIYGDAVPKAKVDAYLEVLGTPEAMGAALNWYRATDFKTSARLGPVRVPTLFVWSTDDIAIARSGAEATKDFVDAPYRFEVLEGVSHWIPEETPDRLRDLLLAHLASVP